jgi:chorismate mutase-like protein
MEDLRKFRDAIDAIDGKLLDLLNERARLAQQIGLVKERNGRPVYAPERAEQLLRRLSQRNAGPLDVRALRAIYVEIMSASLALEKEMTVACEGCPEGRTHFAAKQQFGSSIRYSFPGTLGEVFASVASGGADCGVIPANGDILPLLLEPEIFLTARIPTGMPMPGEENLHFVLGTHANDPSGDDITGILVSTGGRTPESLPAPLLGSRDGSLCFAEIPGHAGDEGVRGLIDSLSAGGFGVKVCGSYPSTT